jgi:outer membrane protein insertion porin family
MNSVTRPRCAISAASNPPPLSGPHHLPFPFFLALPKTQRVFSRFLIFTSVRTAAGTSTKSSLFHAWTRDTRDHPVLGTRGIRAHLRHELAGLGAGAAFYKAEGTLHASRVLRPGLVSQPISRPPTRKRSHAPPPSPPIFVCLQLLSLGASAGALHPLNGGGDSSDGLMGPTLSDRFQLGGPTNLRMFRANSLGPRDGGAPILSSSSPSPPHA